ncbi:MAG: hypothetical protein ABIE94_02870 [archaeon]
MAIDQPYLEARKADTIAILKEMDLADDRMEGWLEKITVVPVERTAEHRESWYGMPFSVEKRIEVYVPTMATAITTHPEAAMRNDGMEQAMIDDVMRAIATIPKDTLFDLIHQSSMDHLLGGGFYGLYHAETPLLGDQEICQTHIDITRFRARTDPHWAAIAEIMPGVLGYHKSIVLE